MAESEVIIVKQEERKCVKRTVPLTPCIIDQIRSSDNGQSEK